MGCESGGVASFQRVKSHKCELHSFPRLPVSPNERVYPARSRIGWKANGRGYCARRYSFRVLYILLGRDDLLDCSAWSCYSFLFPREVSEMV